MSFRRFSRRLAEAWPAGGTARVVVREVDSTNLLARRVAAGYRAGAQRPVAAVFVAYQQTGGRGRGSHRWESPPGRGVYASLLLPAVRPRRLKILPLCVGLALVDALRPLVGRELGLRWPNDLLAGERKLGGVLIDSSSRPGRAATVVLGFGVNYGPVEVSRATSVLEECGARPTADAVRPEDLADLAARLVTAVESELESPADAAAAARRYAAASVHRHGDRLRCRTPEGMLEGRFRGFDGRGFLRLETGEGERSMAAGDLLWTDERR